MCVCSCVCVVNIVNNPNKCVCVCVCVCVNVRAHVSLITLITLTNRNKCNDILGYARDELSPKSPLKLLTKFPQVFKPITLINNPDTPKE